MAVVLAIVAVAVVLAVLTAAHWYLWRRLVRDVSAPGGPWRRTGTLLVCALPALTVATLIAGHAGAPFGLVRVLAWPGYLWLALLLYLLLALVAGELVRLVVRAVVRRRRRSPAAEPADGSVDESADESAALRRTAAAGSEENPTPGRRAFLARSLAAGASLAAAGTVAYGAYEVFKGPAVKRITVPLAKLPRSAHGYRIAVVSDIHLGPVLGRAHTERIVHTINHTQPDLIAIVGDLVDGSVAELGPAAEPLRRLRSRHGAYFVTGNHEYFGDADEWVAHIRELGVHPLENARRELPGFDLAGVNDVLGEQVGEGPDFGKALGGRDPSRASVLLAHQPVQIDQSVAHGVDLQLSGHTHGGQLWPGNYAMALGNPTVAGLDRFGGTQLYVTRGAGAWGPPVRVGAPPDVTVVRLASRQA